MTIWEGKTLFKKSLQKREIKFTKNLGILFMFIFGIVKLPVFWILYLSASQLSGGEDLNTETTLPNPLF